MHQPDRKHRPRFILLTLQAALALLMTACASGSIDDARQLGRMGRHEEAIDALRHAMEEDPGDRRLKVALFTQQEEATADLLRQADSARIAGKPAELEQVLRRMETVAPQHPRTAALKAEVTRVLRLDALMKEANQAFDAGTYERAEATLRSLLAEDSGNRPAREMLARIEEMRARQTRQRGTLSLATARKPVTLEFRDAALRNVFESLARAAGINFVFDKDVRGDAKVTLFLRNTTVEEAMRVIVGTQQLGYKLLNENTVMVYPATQQKQRDLLDTVARTFYLTNADVKQAQALVRTVTKTRDVFIDERLNMMVVRDTPEVVQLVERLIQGLDLPDPEVMLELEVMEVSSKKMQQIGINWPETLSYGNPDSTGAVVLQRPLSASGLSYYVPNPFALATLKASQGATNLLANPRIRARNREKAKVLLGEKLPIFTTTSTANVGVSASVNYLDVGLKLEIEPQVQMDNDVTIKVALEVSSVTDKVIGPQGSIAYQVGTRQASTTLRLKDGETQVLAGLINDSESRSGSGVPGLHDLPIAGRLFGTTTDNRDKTEVVLLVTPRIVRNIVQPASMAAPMPSGTESQPGLAPMQLRDDAQVSGQGGVRGGAASSTGGAMRSTVMASPGAAAPVSPDAVALTGPQEVMPGASFQVMIRNPGSQAIQAGLVIDPTYIEAVAAPNQGPPNLNFSVPARGMQPVMLRAKTGIGSFETAIRLDAGGEPLRLRVRDPNDAARQDVPEADTPDTPDAPDNPPHEVQDNGQQP